MRLPQREIRCSFALLRLGAWTSGPTKAGAQSSHAWEMDRRDQSGRRWKNKTAAGAVHVRAVVEVGEASTAGVGVGVVVVVLLLLLVVVVVVDVDCVASS